MILSLDPTIHTPGSGRTDRWRRNGYGKNILLKSLIVALTLSKYVGIKYLTVDSEPESVDFYRKYGFINAKRRIYDTIPLYKILHPPMDNSNENTLQIS